MRDQLDEENNKIILLGAGKEGRRILNAYGRERVAYFCDNFCSETEVEGIPVIRIDRLQRIYRGYTVVIAVEQIADRIVLSESLEELGIPRTIYGYNEQFGIPHRTIRIHGVVENLQYDFNNRDMFAEIDQIRGDNTMDMYREMFRIYKNDFGDREIDIHICIDDDLLEAYEFAKVCGWRYIHSYSTAYALQDVVVPIPDYRACFNEDNYFYQDATPQKCRDAAGKKYADERAYWIGSLLNLDSRVSLWILGRKYPEHLLVENSSRKRVPMPEQAKYKYLIDVRGYGWTDRVKTLLMCGRPLFLAERPNREWYMDQMVPMKHYVPVREDLSDLIEKIDYLNANDVLYQEIVQNAKRFVDDNLQPKSILKYLRNVTLKYDVS